MAKKRIIALAALAHLWASAAPAATFSVLHAFSGGSADGITPQSPLIRDSSGNLYGTTLFGGFYGLGTIYKLDPAGKLTVLHSFNGQSDGGLSYGGVIRDSAGNLYGANFLAAGTGCGGEGCGTVYKLAASGTFKVLHTFTGGSDGGQPYGSLVHDASGNLYGTTLYGGNISANSTCGVVFKLDPSGALTVLHSFSFSDGANPWASLVRDSVGNMYGTASSGGTGNSGVIFKLDTALNFSVIFNFAGGDGGSSPMGPLSVDSAGNLYGTTESGGTGDFGTAFVLDSALDLTVLHNFVGGSTGFQPYTSDLARDSAGNLYGTTMNGGNSECFCGVVFEKEAAGTYSLLHRFSGGDDGSLPLNGVLYSGGNLFGAASHGGANGAGVIFRIKP
jgi:uncharacterized repeat protein (TIGR03803 family)